MFGKCSLECRQHFNFWGSDVGRIPWCAGITGWHQLAQSSSSQTALLLQEIACGMSTNLAPYDTSVPREPTDAGQSLNSKWVGAVRISLFMCLSPSGNPVSFRCLVWGYFQRWGYNCQVSFFYFKLQDSNFGLVRFMASFLLGWWLWFGLRLIKR